jgi:hypothetical protein
MEKTPLSRHTTYADPIRGSQPFFNDGSGGYDDPFFMPGMNTGEMDGVNAAPTTAPPLSTEREEAFREEISKLMELYEGKVIGDPLYEKVMTQVTWDKLKADEAAVVARNLERTKVYDQQLADYKSGARKQKPSPKMLESEAKTTTCIALQTRVLEMALHDLKMEVREVSQYKNKIAQKIGAKNMIGILKYAIRYGLVKSDEL